MFRTFLHSSVSQRFWSRNPILNYFTSTLPQPLPTTVNVVRRSSNSSLQQTIELLFATPQPLLRDPLRSRDPPVGNH